MSEEQGPYILDQLPQLDGIKTRKVLITELLKILNMEYLAVLVWRLAMASRRGFGSVSIEFKNGHPDVIAWTDSEKPNHMEARDIESLTEKLMEYGRIK